MHAPAFGGRPRRDPLRMSSARPGCSATTCPAHETCSGRDLPASIAGGCGGRLWAAVRLRRGDVRIRAILDLPPALGAAGRGGYDDRAVDRRALHVLPDRLCQRADQRLHVAGRRGTGVADPVRPRKASLGTIKRTLGAGGCHELAVKRTASPTPLCGVTASGRDMSTSTLPEGQDHALIGPNGAGKSTFVGMVSGRIEATEGRVAVSQATTCSPARAPTHRQGHRLHVSRSPRCSAGCRWPRTSPSPRAGPAGNGAAPAKVAEVLEQVGLADRADQTARDLSATATNASSKSAWAWPRTPACSSLDEPTQGLAEAEIDAFKALDPGAGPGNHDNPADRTQHERRHGPGRGDHGAGSRVAFWPKARRPKTSRANAGRSSPPIWGPNMLELARGHRRLWQRQNPVRRLAQRRTAGERPLHHGAQRSGQDHDR